MVGIDLTFDVLPNTEVPADVQEMTVMWKCPVVMFKIFGMELQR